ncbi:hypothetical protein I309_02186 [Cryptococcus deuterogattii LA55]|nr:hypothetical protein I309_02186 [Cryptococcus deuterogattii LA55]KIR71281.1 hypothetical protein I310_05176 [Cryptococcus deuterogattii CA1014]KIR94539.1 hypothetical protein I304_00854 [Cryptococcus deuterogattii CBS 10090]KIS00936.1 hypothetical protein L804_02361 [Cryptococcus deuterogattii 2001/935-1]
MEEAQPNDDQDRPRKKAKGSRSMEGWGWFTEAGQKAIVFPFHTATAYLTILTHPILSHISIKLQVVGSCDLASPPASLSILSVPSFFSSYDYGSMPHSLISPLANEQSVLSPLLRYGPRYTVKPLFCRLLERFIRGTEANLGYQTEEMDVGHLSASHPGIALGMLLPSSNRLDLVAHARDSARDMYERMMEWTASSENPQQVTTYERVARLSPRSVSPILNG